MARNGTEELSPLSALQSAFFDGVVRILRPHRVLRLLVGLGGGTVFAAGLLLAPFWNVPLLAWLDAGQVAGMALIGGSYALGLWHLSRGHAPRTPTDQPLDADLVAQLERLHQLHALGALTEEEFRQAKSRVLE
jgi:hypothetical protein